MTDFALTTESPRQDAEAWLDRRIAARAARRLKTGNANFSITRAEPSASQQRLLRLLKITIPDTYLWARKMLGKAGYRKTGIPLGYSWQCAKALSDQDLVARCRTR